MGSLQPSGEAQLVVSLGTCWIHLPMGWEVRHEDGVSIGKALAEGDETKTKPVA